MTSDREHAIDTVWEGPDGEYLSATVYSDELDRVYIYLNDGDDEAEQALSIPEFQVWASTVLAEVSLIQKKDE